MSLITVVKPDYRYECCLADCCPGLYVQLEMIDEGWRFYPLEIHGVCPEEPVIRRVAYLERDLDKQSDLVIGIKDYDAPIMINPHSWITAQLITITWEEEDTDVDQSLHTADESGTDVRTPTHEED